METVVKSKIFRTVNVIFLNGKEYYWNHVVSDITVDYGTFHFQEYNACGPDGVIDVYLPIASVERIWSSYETPTKEYYDEEDTDECNEQT